MAGWSAAALYAWSLDAILVSGYHSNTDSIYAFFALLAIYFVEERKHYFYAGLALAAAINIKLIPVLLIPTLFVLCRNRRDVTHVFYGLSLGSLPFLWPLIGATEAFYRNALAYTSLISGWGLPYIFKLIGEVGIALHAPAIEYTAKFLRLLSILYGQHFILFSILMLHVTAWRKHVFNGYQLAAMTLALFLIVTPGFGVQYTVAVLPLLFAANLSFGFAYGLISGLFLLLNYLYFWTGETPAYSYFDYQPNLPGALFTTLTGLAAWGILVLFFSTTFRQMQNIKRVAE